jgi:hypothetical protein
MPVGVEQRKFRDFFRKSFEPIEPNTSFTRGVFTIAIPWIISAGNLVTEEVVVMSPTAIGVRKASEHENIKNKQWYVIEQENIKKSGIRVLKSGNIFTKPLVWHP